MINKLVLIILFTASVVGAILLSGCNTFNADYERDNPLDPQGTNFTQSGPESFNVSIQDGIIDITWQDVSDFNSGYIVEKAIVDTSSFDLIAELPEDAEKFRDPSREVGLVVYYKISMLSERDGEQSIIQSETISISISAFHSYSIYSPGKNNVEIVWQVENEFSDGLLIQEKSRFGNQFETVDIIDFDSEDLFGSRYEYKTDRETFNLDVRVTAFQYRENVIVPIRRVTGELSINNPENFEVTFVNELETKIGWDNSVDFSENYLLNVHFDRSGKQLSYELSPNEAPVILNMEMESGRARYTLQAVNGEDRGEEQVIHNNFNIRAPSLSYSSTDLSAVTLHFEKYWEGPALFSAIIVERSVNGGTFEIVAELPAEQEQFIDTDLINSNSYTYKIRTLTTEWHEEIEVSNKNRYVPLYSREVEYIPNLYGINVHFPAADRMVVYRTHFSNVASTDLEVIDIENLNNSVGFDSGSDYFQSRVSPSTDRVVEFVDGNAFGEYDLKIWDLRSESLIRTISAAFVETSLTYIDAILDFSRDGELIASAISNKDETEIKIWNSESGDLSHTIEIPDERLDKFRFNPERDEFIIVTTQGLYIYETESFGLIYELENPSNRSYVPMILSGNGKRLFLYNSRRVYTLDVEAKEILGFNELDSNIEQISTNIDGSELLVRTDNSTGIYDAASLELKYIMKFTYGHPNSLLVLDSKKDGSAVEIKPGHPESPANIIKWQRRDVWHMDLVRQ